jgi:hypothetical protein
MAELETHDPEGQNLKLSYLRNRSKVIEIISTSDMFFVLTQAGVGVAFRAGSYCTLIVNLN